MAPNYNAFNTLLVVTSGSGVIGATGKPVYLQAIYNAQLSGQTVALFSGVAAVTMALVTLATKTYLPYPMSAAGGLTYQTFGNPGDADLKLTFFYVVG